MGATDMGTPPKTSKTASQEHVPVCPTQMPYPPEWAAAAFQAYYGTAPLPPPGYFPAAPGSGPYMWGAQPPMPPYNGTAPAYPPMYLHGGLYGMPPGAHPYNPYALPAGNNLENATCGGGAATGEKKSADGKSKSSVRGSVAMLMVKDNDTTKGPSGSASGTFSQSHGSGSEDSTEEKEEHCQYGSDGGHKANIDPISEGQEVKNGAHLETLPKAMSGKPNVCAEPLTNLNIGIDYWNGGASANQRQKGSVPMAGAACTRASRAGVSGEFWFQDEKEMKRQKRKQSNRESARRSRLRKQAECEELAVRVSALESENSNLRSQLSQLSEKCKKLSTEKESLMEQLRHFRVRRGETKKELQLDSFQRKENDSFGVGKESGNLTCSVPLA